MTDGRRLGVFLLVHLVLFGVGDVAAVGTRIGVVFTRNCTITGAQRLGLATRQFAFAALVVDAAKLVMFAGQHFMLTRVLVRPGPGRGRA